MLATWPDAAERQVQVTPLDDDINTYLHIVQQLRTRRNTLMPACCLLPEVLSEIFSYLVPIRVHDNHDIIAVTHVCRCWRDVALAFPHLWSHIHSRLSSSSQISLAEMMYERAADAVLTIEVDADDTDERIHLIEELARQLHRTHVFKLEPSRGQYPGFVENLVVDCPILESFWICVGGSRSDSDVLLPNGMFRNASRLQMLHLSGCALHWDSLALNGLTCLELSHLRELAPAPSELLGLLEGNSALQDLELVDVLAKFWLTPSSWNADVAINLPNLRHLALSDITFIQYAHFLSRLNVPPETHITLDITIPEGRSPNSLMLFPARVLTPYRDDPGIAYSVSIEHGYRTDIDIAPLIESNCPQCSYQTCRSHLDATFRYSGSDRDHSAYSPFTSLCSGSPLFSIQKLTIDTGDEQPFGAILWRDVFLALPNLTFLDISVEEDNLTRALDALAPGESLRPLPQLEELVLCPASGHQGGAENLADALEKRAKAGLHLKSLTNRGIELSRSVIVRVRWMVVGILSGFD
ncbi:hypothetical protein CONPUDRAFT_162042 [Coniophora puteana RWD-64-598 SS2]|uniref:F-box domain-containing protein n=1 Tax=Coniophora puteana (strain RWD-64-598) TaxID=741705 RepID=A0A5M3N0Y4_CONPW|nr:uncharacterized protein CONPUDRAFT_162042 [Coniophora puteana RWD-64-598 SS2]EIW84674.1 hypothetical protein CONPUDRAFT_162042 [Coniophora puteana RWD-64-598 SS2]